MRICDALPALPELVVPDFVHAAVDAASQAAKALGLDSKRRAKRVEQRALEYAMD